MMQHDAAAAIEQKLSRIIDSMYRQTVLFQRTQAEHKEAMRESVWKTDDFERAPQWVKSRLNGVDEVYSRMLFEPSLSGDKPPLVAVLWYQRRIITLDDVQKIAGPTRQDIETRHVWRAALAQGVTKFY